jgi:Mrp family chromosome partitioning ATPase/capsular polysaccharide biosynthesis protein
MHAPQLEPISFQPIQRSGQAIAFEARIHNEEVVLGALRLLWQNRKLFGLVAGGAIVFATVFLVLTPKRYTAESIVRLDFESGNVSAAPRVALDASAVVESEARIIRSRSMAEEVVSRLKLADNAAFSAPPGLATRVLEFLMRRSAVDDRRSVGGIEASAAAVPRSPEFARAVARVMGSTAVENDNKSYLIAVRFRWSSPNDAATLANALAQEYLRERYVQSLVTSRSRLESELAQLDMRLGDKYPTVLAAKTQLAVVENRLRAWETAATSPVRAVALDNFTAEIAIPAQAPLFPASPNPKAVYALTLLLSLVFAAALLLLRQRYDTGLASERAVADRLGVRCFGMVPDVTVDNAPGVRVALSEAVRAIYVAAELDVPFPKCRVVLLTSSLPDEGKTLFGSSLASIVAESGRRVLLLDTVPRIKYRPEPPAVEAVDAVPAAVRDKPSVAYQTVNFRGRGSPAAIDFFERYLAVAREAYDVIIVKAPPVLLLADAAKFARHSDILMLLVHWRRTPGQAVADAIHRLREAGIRVSGVVLSNVNLRQHGSEHVWGQGRYLAEYGEFYSSFSSSS